jgi:hypothetical protein
MEYRLFDSNIEDNDIEQKLNKKIKYGEYDKTREYDLSVEYFNADLIEDSLNEEVSYEIKKKHLKFIRDVRNIFEKNSLRINKFYLMGTVNIDENNMALTINKSNFKTKSNEIWPCKEIFIFEDSKNKLDTLLVTNQISEEEYEDNLEDLRDELSIYENEEEHEYLN